MKLERGEIHFLLGFVYLSSHSALRVLSRLSFLITLSSSEFVFCVSSLNCCVTATQISHHDMVTEKVPPFLTFCLDMYLRAEIHSLPQKLPFDTIFDSCN